MLGQATESDDMTSRRPSLIIVVFAACKKTVHLTCDSRVKTNLQLGFSSSYTQHRATASKMVLFQADIRSWHVSITDESDLREEILSSSCSRDAVRCTPGGGG